MTREDGLLTCREAATLASRSNTTISSWTRRGLLPFTTVKQTRMPYRIVLYRPLDVIRLAVDQEAKCQKMNHGKNTRRRHEETLEELEAIIAERLLPENLPNWWHDECAKSQGFRLKDLLEGKE